jgi:hypothetical protein
MKYPNAGLLMVILDSFTPPMTLQAQWQRVEEFNKNSGE